MNLEFRVVSNYSDTIHIRDCSDPDYFTDGELVERKERKFISGLILYRYRDCYMTEAIELLQFKVIRETEASYLLIDGDQERWVRKNATRSFAYDKKEDAWRNFRKRKEKQLKILKNQIRRVENVLHLIRKFESNNGDDNARR